MYHSLLSQATGLGIHLKLAVRLSISQEHGAPACETLFCRSPKIVTIVSWCPQEYKDMEGDKRARIRKTRCLFFSLHLSECMVYIRSETQTFLKISRGLSHIAFLNELWLNDELSLHENNSAYVKHWFLILFLSSTQTHTFCVQMVLCLYILVI